MQNVRSMALVDIVAFRILVPSSRISTRPPASSNYPTVMGRFKDYISTPKRNGYQSLHTGLRPAEPPDRGPIRTGHASCRRTWCRGALAVQGRRSAGPAAVQMGELACSARSRCRQFWNTKWTCTAMGFAAPAGRSDRPSARGHGGGFYLCRPYQIGETRVGVRINGKTRQLATELQNGDQIEIQTASQAKPRRMGKFREDGRRNRPRRFHRAQPLPNSADRTRADREDIPQYDRPSGAARSNRFCRRSASPVSTRSSRWLARTGCPFVRASPPRCSCRRGGAGRPRKRD